MVPFYVIYDSKKDLFYIYNTIVTKNTKNIEDCYKSKEKIYSKNKKEKISEKITKKLSFSTSHLDKKIHYFNNIYSSSNVLFLDNTNNYTNFVKRKKNNDLVYKIFHKKNKIFLINELMNKFYEFKINKNNTKHLYLTKIIFNNRKKTKNDDIEFDDCNAIENVENIKKKIIQKNNTVYFIQMNEIFEKWDHIIKNTDDLTKSFFMKLKTHNDSINFKKIFYFIKKNMKNKKNFGKYTYIISVSYESIKKMENIIKNVCSYFNCGNVFFITADDDSVFENIMLLKKLENDEDFIDIKKIKYDVLYEFFEIFLNVDNFVMKKF